MKAYLTVLLVTVFILFGTKLRFVDSTSQEWVGGIYEAGKGTNYKITLLAKASAEKLQVEDLWIGDDYFKVQAIKNLARKSDLSFAKRDTIYVVSSINFKPTEDGKMEQVKLLKKDPPVEMTGVALLGYSWKGKKKYMNIASFRKLKKLIYP